jgi:UDP-2-acetamido-3-amino-2,3-dideoxy-glucuronate N-acetyltransferase
MTYIHETAILDPGAEIGDNTMIWHFTHIMSKAKIGESVSIGQNCFVGDNVVIGDNAKIQNNVSVYDGVIIENDVFVGPSVVFTNVKLPKSLEPVNKNYTKTIIRKGVTLGANSTIICGIEIGENAFIGAGSVVTKDVPPNTMWYGNPAKQIKK